MNSLSWDAALLNISVGGYSRRIDWDNPNFYIYNPGWNHHPLDLNKMKLFQCDRAACDDPERYHPTDGDKHAEDWIPTIPPQIENTMINETKTIRLGKYFLKPLDDESYWFESFNGEGTGINKKYLSDIIESYFKDTINKYFKSVM